MFAIYLIKRFFFQEGAEGYITALAKVVAKTWSAVPFLERILVFQDDGKYKAKCDRAISALLEEIQKSDSHTEALLGVINTLDERYTRMGILREKVDWERLKERIRKLPAKNRAGWLNDMGVVLQRLGEPKQAKGWYGQSLEIEKELGNRSGIASTLHQLGNIAQDKGDYEEARKLYGESLGISKELGNRSGIAITLGQLGRLAEAEGNELEAFTLYLMALNTFAELKAPLVQLAFSDIARLRERVGPEEFAKLVKQAGEEMGQDLSVLLEWFKDGETEEQS